MFCTTWLSALPIAIITLPQLASSPAIAVLTNGELAIEKLTSLACLYVFAPLTLTSINLDGTMKGYDIETLSKASANVEIPIIASGGAGKLKDFNDVVKNADVSALAAASIYHFTNTTPRDVKIYLNSEKIPVRIN